MSEPPTTRSSGDGFKGDYPKPNDDWAAELYRANGMEPPWLLEYENGKVVGSTAPKGPPVPRHEA
ncbi:hypothetical protein [Kitasatospora herbaricolor]|uniref:hypothetical protein n=1 Tax=Kitasatospora herbaricolor TaxID=68217 RepID=UPI0036D8667D